MIRRHTGGTMITGVTRFSRYAYPPNALGYCGPDQAQTLLEQAAAGAVDQDLVRMVHGFEGAWPYLELIASANGIREPIDERIVEAYWVGSPLLDRVLPTALGRSLEERFKPRMGRRWAALSATPLDTSAPHHNFHVFVVYPWVGMLRLGRVTEPLTVLDRCRIRWGTIERTEGPTATVRVRPLSYDGDVLSLGAPVTETARVSANGHGFLADLHPGDRVSLHWEWVCERLSGQQVHALATQTARALRTANEVLRRPAGSVLG